MGRQGVALVNTQEIDSFMLDYMEKHKINQEDFAEAIGLGKKSQSRISDIKNKGSAHFTVEQVCNFAISYDQSLDDMADIYNKSEISHKREKTFKDILSRLFYIAAAGACETSIDDLANSDGVRVSFNFDGGEMAEMIKQWKTAASLNVKDKSGQRVYDIVKSSLLNAAIDLKHSYNYQSKQEYARKLYLEAEETLKRAGYYHEENYDIQGLYVDEYTGQPLTVIFGFPRNDYDLLCEMYAGSFLISQIEVLIHDNGVEFLDLPF